MLQQDMLRGSLGTVRESLGRAQASLKEAQYKDIDYRHKQQLIELRMTEMAGNDLDKYHKVRRAWNEMLLPLPEGNS